MYAHWHKLISDLKRSIQYKDLVDYCRPGHIIWHFPRIADIWNGHSLSSKYSTSSNSLQGKCYNVIAVHVSYAGRYFMCIASLKAKPKQGLQLFSLYMWAGLQKSTAWVQISPICSCLLYHNLLTFISNATKALPLL